MEFLMTYGWAILVVLAAIGALAYFGVLSPDKFLPEKCTFPSGLDCIDKPAISGTSISVAVKNNIGYPMIISSVTTDACTLTANNSVTVNGLAPPQTVQNNAQATIALTCNAALSGRVSGDITVNYVNQETNLSHAAVGSITGRA